MNTIRKAAKLINRAGKLPRQEAFKRINIQLFETSSHVDKQAGTVMSGTVKMVERSNSF